MKYMIHTAAATAALMSANVLAQCPGCAINTQCFTDPAYPTLCPAQPPDATAGEAYGTDITFWLPASFEDPGTGALVDFLQMTITGVGGLPFGLDLEANEPSGIYDPQQNAFGCARICGTPLSAGTYAITISIVAQVSFNGLTLNVPQQFSLPLNVLPGTGANNGFTFSPTTGCGPTTVQFNASIDGQGAPVSYAWELGDGSTSSASIFQQTYSQPGTYPITLQTTIGGYVLNAALVNGVSDNWCGDVEEPSVFGACTGDPDIYFVLTDGGGNTWTSSSGDNSTSAAWNTLGRQLSAPPYSIAFFDEDVVSQNDALGTFNIPQGVSGTLPFALGNGTSGSLVIDLEPVQVFNDTDTVVIYPVPQPVLVHDTAAGTLCITDTGLVSITWFNDGDTVFTGGLTCWGPDSAGTWWATVNNGFGCLAATDTVVLCPQIAITQNGNVLFTATGLDNYQWTLNGTPVAGADGPFIIAETGGEYGVSATNADGCVLQASFTLLITGVPGGLVSGAPQALLLPDGDRLVRVAQGPAILTLRDAMGRTVAQWMLTGRGPSEQRIATATHAPGVYTLEVLAGDRRTTLRIPIAR
jgi:hypothetical protein